MLLPPSPLPLVKGSCLQVVAHAAFAVECTQLLLPAFTKGIRFLDGWSDYLRSERCLRGSGNLRTSDFDGPYNITLLDTQYNEIKGKHTQHISTTRLVLV